MFTVGPRRPFDFEKWVNLWVNQLSEKQVLILENIHRNNEIKKS
jgi:ATP-dependent DNA helicase RecG